MKNTNPHPIIAAPNSSPLRDMAIVRAHNAVIRNQMPAGPRRPVHRADGIDASALALKSSDTVSGESPSSSSPIAAA